MEPGIMRMGARRDSSRAWPVITEDVEDTGDVGDCISETGDGTDSSVDGIDDDGIEGARAIVLRVEGISVDAAQNAGSARGALGWPIGSGANIGITGTKSTAARSNIGAGAVCVRRGWDEVSMHSGDSFRRRKSSKA